jgi:hypothetical protein
VDAQAPDQVARAVAMPASTSDHRELVAAQTPDDVLLARVRSVRSVATPLEHRVAGQVAERVVDLLERVQVDRDDRQLAIPKRRARVSSRPRLARGRPGGCTGR